MIVLTATHLGQGDRPGDFCHTVDGELVTPIAVECCTPDACGCGRGFPGLASGRATTTAQLVDRADIHPADLRRAVADSLDRGGWRHPDHPDEFVELVREHVAAIALLGRTFPAGAVLRRDGPAVWADLGHPAA